MKAFKLFLAVLSFALLAPVASQAAVASTEAPQAAIERSEVKKEKKLFSEAKMAKMEKKLAKKMKKINKILGKSGNSVDFNDPVDKWMWFWIFGWGGAILISVLSVFTGGFLWYLSYLLWTAGTVCLIIWLVKKFGGDL
ncbi:MAG: hypothetical protein R2792_10610 [Saprospiraceae bacterium]